MNLVHPSDSIVLPEKRPLLTEGDLLNSANEVSCTKCNKSFNFEEDFFEHMRSVHPLDPLVTNQLKNSINFSEILVKEEPKEDIDEDLSTNPAALSLGKFEFTSISRKKLNRNLFSKDCNKIIGTTTSVKFP